MHTFARKSISSLLFVASLLPTLTFAAQQAVNPFDSVQLSQNTQTDTTAITPEQSNPSPTAISTPTTTGDTTVVSADALSPIVTVNKDISADARE